MGFTRSTKAIACICAFLMLVIAAPALANNYYLQGNTTSYLSYSVVPGGLGNPSSIGICYEMVGKPANATWSVAGQFTTTGTVIVTAPAHPIPVVTSGISATPSSGSKSQYIAIGYALGPGPGCTAPMDFDYLVVDPQTNIPPANDGTITSGFTGNWFDASQTGHGFSIEVLPGDQMLAEWYVFGPAGGQTWLVATGPVTGKSAVLQAFLPFGAGGRFPPNFDQTQVKNQAWGSITFTFTDCDHGNVTWQPTLTGYSAGTLPITRLTIPAGLSCP